MKITGRLFLVVLLGLLMHDNAIAQLVNVNVRILRFYNPTQSNPRWNVWLEGATNTDDADFAEPCFARFEAAPGWYNSFVFRDPFPYYIFGGQGKSYNSKPDELKGTFEGFEKHCVNDGWRNSNGDYCDFKDNCYDRGITKNGNSDKNRSIANFSIDLRYKAPGVWYKDQVKAGNYIMEYEVLFTPPKPSAITFNGGTNNVCGGQTFQLQATGVEGGDYIWEENTNGETYNNRLTSPLRYYAIEGQNSSTLTVTVPDNIPPGTIITKKYRAYKRNGISTSLESTEYGGTFNFYPAPPKITLSDLTIFPLKCKGDVSGQIKVNRVDGYGSYAYSLGKPDRSLVVNSTVNYPLFPNDGNNTDYKTGLPGGEYLLTIQNKGENFGGCFTALNLTIPEPNAIVFSSPQKSTYAGGKNIKCNGEDNGSLILKASGGTPPFSYVLDNESTFAIPNIISASGVFNNLKAGSYYGRVTDNNGCIKNYSTSITLTEPAILTSDISGADLKCFESGDGVILFNNTQGGTAPRSFSVNAGNSYVSSSVFNSLSSGTYNCIVKDANGCLISKEVVLNQPEKLLVFANDVSGNECHGYSNGFFSASYKGGTGTVMYSLDNAIFQKSSDFKNLEGGNHLLKIRDANGCLDTAMVSIYQPDSITINFVTENVQCSGFKNGKVTAKVSGGTPSYNFLWSTSETDTLIENLEPGNYNLKITDSNNCIYSRDVLITEPKDSLSVNIKSIKNAYCNSICSGEAEIEALGGTAPYNFKWMHDTLTQSTYLKNLCKGKYKLRLEDANNCATSSIIQINDSINFSFDIPETTTICPGQKLLADAKNPGCTYLWEGDNGYINNVQKVELTKSGQYRIKVIDPRGCFASDTFYLNTSDKLLKAKFLLPSSVALGDTVIFAQISWPQPDSIRWSFDGAIVLDSSTVNPKLYYQNAGSYEVKLTAYLGECRDSVTKTITFYVSDPMDGDSLRLGYNRIQEMKLYPNPNNGTFKLSVKLDEVDDVNLSIFNSQSIPVSYHKDAGRKEYLFDFDLDLNQGVYVLKIQSSDEYKTITFIVQ